MQQTIAGAGLIVILVAYDITALETASWWMRPG